MNLLLKHVKLNLETHKLHITGSKSETNRLLLLKALYPKIMIENASNSDDSEVMAKALKNVVSTSSQSIPEIDVHHAGTAMRFLTAFFAIKNNTEVVLTGSSRMKERPIKILVDALKQLGSLISYEQIEGFPPIRIQGKKITKNKVSLAANVSSQYISALLLIGPKLENGIELTLNGQITSLPYIKMTLALLNEIGAETSFVDNIITVKPAAEVTDQAILTIESDWSSASYWYSIIALSTVGVSVTLSSYKKNSRQGDSVLAEIYENFGVQTIFNVNNTITISKINNVSVANQTIDLIHAPDIAQTIAVTCFGLKVACNLTGLHTLKIKETDRLEALKTELLKLGANIETTNNSLHLRTSDIINQNCTIATYQDHRMAMAFAPLALKVPLIIQNSEVVSKSYPTFFTDLQLVGFQISEQLEH